MGRSTTAPQGGVAAVLVLTAFLHRMGSVTSVHASHDGGGVTSSLSHFALETDTRPAAPYDADVLEVGGVLLPSDCGDRSVSPPHPNRKI